MATKKVELLLNRTIENLGLVGDVVKVKPGFARNYLLPHGFAEAPTPEKIEALKDLRAKPGFTFTTSPTRPRFSMVRLSRSSTFFVAMTLSFRGRAA